MLVVFKVVLPVEATAKTEASRQLEKTLTPARSYQQALDQLKSWTKMLGTTVTQLQAQPDPDRLFESVWPLFEALVKQDPVFASDIGEFLRQTGVRQHCTVQSLMQFLSMIESLLSAKTREEAFVPKGKGSLGQKVDPNMSSASPSGPTNDKG
eukprot:546378-Amphidinium_carterae.1